MNDQPIKKQTFLQGTAVLAMATVLVKLMGFLFKVPLNNIIGEDGFGYFNTAYDVYNVLLMISTTGLPVAMSRMISQAHPDLLITCFGCPKQEKWIYENIEKYDAKVSICAGATVDFLAGNVTRAPRWMSEHGLEWFYRFLQEPRRMFRRYFVDDMKIIGLIKKYR